MLAYYNPFDRRPSVTAAGASYVELHEDGRARLHLRMDTGGRLIVDLVAARLSEPSADATVTLAAIAPAELLAGSIRTWMGTSAREFCVGSTVEDVVQSIRQFADIPISGVSDATVTCDGISFAMTFAGTPVSEIPPDTVRSKCPEATVGPVDGGSHAAADGGP